MFELADIERDPAERRRLLTFVVAGGGYAGTEIAGELADFVRLLTKREYSGIRRDECRVVIVHPGPTLLPELYGSQSAEGQGRGKGYAKLVEYATKHTRKLGVELLLETARRGRDAARRLPLERRARADADDRQRRRDGGAAALRHDRDPAGRARPRAHGRAACASRASRTSGPAATAPRCPIPTAAPARRSASTRSSTARGSARTSAASSQGKEPEPFRYPGLGQGVSIGRRTAVGELKGIPIRGLFCWIVWRSMLFYFFPTWDRRLRLLADWSIWPLVGRDIVQLGRGDHGEYEILHHVYQPGQVIAERARPVRHVHVIVEGEVELVTGEEIVENLRAGDHFGRKSIELSRADTARARTLVRTVALRADQANELQDMLLSTERIVARTGTFQTIRPGGHPSSAGLNARMFAAVASSDDRLGGTRLIVGYVAVALFLRRGGRGVRLGRPGRARATRDRGLLQSDSDVSRRALQPRPVGPVRRRRRRRRRQAAPPRRPS